MNRLPSLAAGISGAGFEWDPSLARIPSLTPSDLNTESHLTFASAPTDDSSSRPAQSTAQSQAGTSADASTGQHHLHEAFDGDSAGDPMAEDKAEDSSMSPDATQEEEAGAGSLFSAMQTKAPGLTPLRLTPKTELAQDRSAALSLHPPPLTLVAPCHPTPHNVTKLQCDSDDAYVSPQRVPMRVHLRLHKHLGNSSGQACDVLTAQFCWLAKAGKSLLLPPLLLVYAKKIQVP